MDELEISGKRYISAKRIAKENKYHPDYMGQLIRAGRVVGTKVGRAWYVDEQSFAEYVYKEKGAAYTPSPAQPLSSTVNNSTDELPVKPTPSLMEPYQQVSFEKDPIRPVGGFESPQEPSQNFSKETIAPVSQQVAPAPFIKTYTYAPASATRTIPVQKPALTYVSDNNPLFPAIPKKIKEAPQPIAIQQVEIIKDSFKDTDIAEMSETPSNKRAVLGVGIALTSLAIVAGLFFGMTFFGSLGINSTVIIEKGKPASVIYAQEKTFCFIFGDCQIGQK